MDELDDQLDGDWGEPELYGWLFRIPFVLGVWSMFLASASALLFANEIRALTSLFTIGLFVTLFCHFALLALERA